MPGLSALALSVPKPRVSLEAWCRWTGAPAEKVRAVVGEAFRVPARHEDVYTLAANAVLAVIERNDVDPSRVGYLVLATESSTDNAVGAPTVRGMVDAGLAARGLPPLARQLEAFEMKQACLAGMNGLLGAVRFVSCEPEQVAIVVSGDIAEYARGSSGEQTQGAGAVAMLVEAEAKLLEIDPSAVGRSATDRGFDFRKPTRGRTPPAVGWPEARLPDFPAFAGHYSTYCYLDAVDGAFAHALERNRVSARELLDGAEAVLLHRPYEKMPQTSVARLYLRALRETPEGRGTLAELAASAGVELGAALRELENPPAILDAAREQGVDVDPHPSLSGLTRAINRSPAFRERLAAWCGLGRAVVRELGNLYSASLPAWIGAALEDAAKQERELAGKRLLLIGYGSGDAALAIPARVVEGWREAAGKLGFAQALEGAIDIEQAAYERAHDRVEPVELPTRGEAMIAAVGDGTELGFDDRGVTRYAYAP